MVRSYVLTSTFLLFRLMFYGLLGIDGFPYKEEVGGVTARASWSILLLLCEVMLQGKKIQYRQLIVNKPPCQSSEQDYI